jgi:molecular chaperone GrpE
MSPNGDELVGRFSLEEDAKEDRPREDRPRDPHAAGRVEEMYPPAGGQSEEPAAWRDRALRLQAERENYRKRQWRLAQDRIEAERGRLLADFLPVLDDLERALEAPAGDGEALREGVELTYRAALRRLQKEGVEQIPAEGGVFDPKCQEAVASVRHNGGGSASGTVVQVLEQGYRLGDRLIRPAKVIVAV